MKVRDIMTTEVVVAHPDTSNLIEAQLSDLSEQVSHPSIGHTGLPIDFYPVFHAVLCLLR